jgi:mannose-6-phosphate isomerase-like protein (cupin superfamily)
MNREGQSSDVIHLHELPIVSAPDGSHIRELARVHGASMAHCRLPAGSVTTAVRHRQIEEVWFVLAGSGRVWRQHDGGDGQVVEVRAGDCLTIAVHTAFQFRADDDLEMLLATALPWPGPEEALPVDGLWPSSFE